MQLTPLGRYCPGAGADPPAPRDVRTIPVRAAELRGDRLSPGIDAPTRGPAQPVRLVDSDRRRARAEADARVDRSRPGRGLTPESMLETLTRHSQRPLPPGVVDAVRNWATRRERVTYYAAATLIEFGSAADRDSAAGILAVRTGIAADPGRRAVPAGRGRANDPVRSVPPDQLARLSPPPEVCVTVEADGDHADARSGARGPAGRSRAGAVRRHGLRRSQPADWRVSRRRGAS